MMEAMNAGSVDYGAVGDSPPVFRAICRRCDCLCRVNRSQRQGILVQSSSQIRSLADLKDKRVGFTRFQRP